VGSTPVADGVLLEWEAVESGGAVVTYIIERSLSESGPWEEVTRTTETRYLYSDGTGQTWYFRITATVRGQAGGSEIVVGTPELVARQRALEQEILDRLAGDFAAVAEAVADARAYTDTQVAALNGILEDIVGADEWVAGTTYPKGDFVRHEGTMYRALAENTGVVPGSNPSVWQEIGDYTSVGDALAAAISMSIQNASDIAAESVRIDGVVVRMPPGADQLARSSQVASEQQARIDGDNVLGQRIDTVSVTAGDAQSTAAQAITAANNAASVAATAQTAANGAQSTASQALAAANNAATVATQVSLQLGKGDNLFIDPGFAAPNAMVRGWGETAVYWQRNFNPQSFRPFGINVYGAQPAGFPVGWWNYLVPTKLTRVKPNTWYIGSIYYAAQRTAAGVDVIVYDQNNASLQEVGSPLAGHTPSDWSQPSGYRRAFVKFKTGANAVYAAVNGRAYGSSSGDPYVLFFWPQLEEAAEAQTEPTPYKESAAGNAVATQALSVGIDGVDGRLKAKQTLTTDVNGNIAGYVSENDGTRSSFSILATVFRVISSLTGMGMEWQDGYLRIWRSAAQLILGHTFGSGNLVMWYGPNVGAANCTKANATFWLDTSGGAYFGGSLSAGALKNAVQTTTTVTVGTELINGPFNTNGNVRAVTISFARNTAYVSNASGSGGFSGGVGANTATVAVYRRIGSAAETLWQTLNVSGGLEILNEPDAPDRANSYWSGAMTVNDTSPAADAVRYRAVITAFNAQAVEHPGTINSITTTQNLAIVSVES